MTSNDPDLWKVPSWHPDYGDVTGDIEHLRDVGKAIFSIGANLEARLEVPEPGLLFISVMAPKKCIAEIYSVMATESGRVRKYGVFLHPSSIEEEEVYCDTVDDVINVLARDTG